MYFVTELSHTTEHMCGTIGARLSVVDAFQRVAGPGCPAGLLCEGAAPGDHSASSSRQLLRTRSAHWRTFCPDGSIQAAKCSARRSGLDLPHNRSVGSYAPDPPAFSGHPGQHIKKGILYAKEIGPLPDALFSPPQSEEQCCELDRSTVRFFALESDRESLAYDSPVFIR